MQLTHRLVRDAINMATATLKASQSTNHSTNETESAATDARRLLAQALDCSALDLITQSHRQLTSAEAQRFASVVLRRATGEPVSRISGHRGFYGRDFLISPATLDPRPETETLVDAALTRFDMPEESLRILDIGTGSGCLLLTLLAERPKARGVGIDPSREALSVAASNADRLEIAHRVTWLQSRIEDVKPEELGRFPLIVSNPPYIPTAAIGLLDRDVRCFDPHLALDGGLDGLDIYRAIAATLNALAAPGWLFLEVGNGQASDVAKIMCQSSLRPRISEHDVIADMAGIHRCVAIRTL
jgi:release factor glutamine methyltransferase